MQKIKVGLPFLGKPINLSYDAVSIKGESGCK